MPLPEPHKVKTVVDPELSLRFSTYVKNAFVLALREAFSHEATPVEYRYYKPNDPASEVLTPGVTSTREAERKRQIAIYRAWPKRDVMFPCIIVETELADASITTLGGEQQNEVYEDDGRTVKGVVYSGTMFMPVKISIYAQTPTDRERITDLVTIYVRYVFRDLFYREEIPYLDIQAGEVGDEDVPGVGRLFVGEVSLKCQTEFDQFIDQSLIDKVMSISIKNVHFGTDASDMQSNNVSG